ILAKRLRSCLTLRLGLCLPKNLAPVAYLTPLAKVKQAASRQRKPRHPPSTSISSPRCVCIMSRRVRSSIMNFLLEQKLNGSLSLILPRVSGGLTMSQCSMLTSPTFARNMKYKTKLSVCIFIFFLSFAFLILSVYFHNLIFFFLKFTGDAEDWRTDVIIALI